MDLEQTEALAISIARGAGALIIQGIDKEKSLSRKSSDLDLLTKYDNESDEYISERVQNSFPGHKILSEENASKDRTEEDTTSGYVWHVDPLDGTVNFVHGYPVFAVSLALYHDNRPLVGVVYDPARDECFSAISGLGASVRVRSTVRQIQTSNTDGLLDSLLATGFPYDRHHSNEDNLAQTAAFLKRARGLRRSGAAAIDLAYVAAGRLDGYWELRLNSWDVAAGVLLVTEAGGLVSRADGQPLRLESQVSIVASNRSIHQAMLDVLDGVPRDSKEGN